MIEGGGKGREMGRWRLNKREKVGQKKTAHGGRLGTT